MARPNVIMDGRRLSGLRCSTVKPLKTELSELIIYIEYDKLVWLRCIWAIKGFILESQGNKVCVLAPPEQGSEHHHFYVEELPGRPAVLIVVSTDALTPAP